jgi:hypothetical protein
VAGGALPGAEVIMLVTFSCQAYADITMFGNEAIRLLKLMGHSGTVPGALLAEDVQAALQRLEAVFESDEQVSQPEKSTEGENNGLAAGHPHRTLPLVELLKAAAKEQCNVMWDSGN